MYYLTYYFSIIGLSHEIGKRAIKLLAAYFDNPANKEIILLQLKEWISDPIAGQVRTLQMVASSIYVTEDNTKEAFRILKEGNNLEQ